ncbi:uncharacterized protein LOC109827062 [Asparagus officinalis]|uniref:uncharacterized protein LOC109827062 n=1 Tax=Asparagus officinalis TaxID=4686 RepID=UPI00098E6CB8|nr:uncharacterized protein LOC109827062 [Asparagus officinalis]
MHYLATLTVTELNVLMIAKELQDMSSLWDLRLCTWADRDNYASWAIKMKVYMKAQDVWDAIEPAAGASVEHRKDQMALAAIYQGIPEETLMVIAEKQTAKEAWETLKTMHLGADRVRNAKVQTLKSEFELLRMKENDNVDDFSTKLTGVVNKIRALGGEMEENYVVRKLLRAVPERFLTIVSTIEQFGDIDDMTLEEAIGRLKAHEERARVFRNNVDDHLLLTHAEWQARSKKNGGGFLSTPTTNDGGGRGRGPRSPVRRTWPWQRGRGRQPHHGQRQQHHAAQAWPRGDESTAPEAEAAGEEDVPVRWLSHEAAARQ